MESRTTATDALRRLGLRANPFDISSINSADPSGVKLAIRAASLRLLGKLDQMAEDPDHRPIVIDKGDLPRYYHVAPLSQSLAALGRHEGVAGLLPLYVPIDMMRVGRVRAVLHTAAEAAAGAEVTATMALWAARVLEAADVDLPEWQALEAHADELPALIARLRAEPEEAGAEVFGEPVQARAGVDDLEALVRVSGARLDRLESDPTEGDTAAPAEEDAVDDPMADAFVTPLGEDDVSPRSGPIPAAAIVDYVVAHTAKHLSPVVSRGVRAYVAQGRAAMTEELKISKAPTKTLVAVLDFVSSRYRSTALIIDRLEMWPTLPADLRLKIVNTLTSLRWAIKDTAGLVLILPAGIAPEVEEAFASAHRLMWDYEELPSVQSADSVFDPGVVSSWIEDASLDGLPVWASDLLKAIPADTPLQVAADALCATIDDAVATEAPEPDREVLSRLLVERTSTSA